MGRASSDATLALVLLAAVASAPDPGFAQDSVARAAEKLARANETRAAQRAYLAQGGTLQRQALGPRIFLGDDTPQEATNWAWTVTIRVDGQHWCGGALVSPVRQSGETVISGWREDDRNPRWVLTAAHCLFDRQGNAIPAEAITVGSASVNRLEQRISPVEALVPHPDFDGKTLVNDVALIHLPPQDPLPAGSGLKRSSIRLPHPQEVRWLYREYTALTVFGWGRTEHSAMSDILQQVRLPFVGRDVCNGAFVDVGMDPPILGGMMCAGFSTGSYDSCNGDSGGPATFIPPHVRNDPVTAPVLVGIVSWGRGCAMPGMFGVYTHVLSYLAWIEQAVIDNS